MAITRTPDREGYPALGLLPDLVIGCETLQKGIAQLIPGHRNIIDLRRFYATGDNIEARTYTWAAGAIADAMTKDEKTITLTDIQLQDTFNPQDFQLDHRDLYPSGAGPNAGVAPILNAAIRTAITGNFNNSLDRLLWRGDSAGATGGYLDLLDGFEKIIDADASVINVTPAGAVTIANVETILQAVIDACPVEVKELGNPTIVVPPAIKYLWRAFQESNGTPYKGVNLNEMGADQKGGYPIVSINGISPNRIFMYNTQGDGAELKVGLWSDSDRFTIDFGKGHDLDDLIGLKIVSDIGVQTLYGKQITEYSPA